MHFTGEPDLHRLLRVRAGRAPPPPPPRGRGQRLRSEGGCPNHGRADGGAGSRLLLAAWMQAMVATGEGLAGMAAAGRAAAACGASTGPAASLMEEKGSGGHGGSWKGSSSLWGVDQSSSDLDGGEGPGRIRTPAPPGQ